jgi:transcriptional regulator with XRE-family HTH domain
VNNVRNETYILAFGKRLKEIRKSKEISQEELSYTAQIPLSQVGRIERGEVNTTISTVFILASALTVHPRELFNFDISQNVKQ